MTSVILLSPNRYKTSALVFANIMPTFHFSTYNNAFIKKNTQPFVLIENKFQF